MRMHLWLLLAVIAPVAEAQPAQPVEEPDLRGTGVRGYVYIEPFEIRRELVVGLSSISEDRGDPAYLDQTARQDHLEALRDALADACRVRIEGVLLAAEEQEVRFIAIDPKLGPVPDERERIPFEEALIGAVFVTSRSGFPGRIEVDWTLFPAGSGRPRDVGVEIEVMTGAEVHGHSMVFAPGGSAQEWVLPDLAPTPGLVAVAEAPSSTPIGPYVVAILLGVVAFALLAVAVSGRVKDRASLLVSAALSVILAAGVSYDLAFRPSSARVTEPQARGIVGSLLTNIYHAFAFRDESVIFDTLARSVEGPLLEEIYLDIRRGLELEDGGGPRVRLLDVSLIDCVLLQATSGELRARVVWVSRGDVNHWGHTHRRRNQYRAELLIRAFEGQWKVTEVDILSEERT
jgi:hypothetical protein